MIKTIILQQKEERDDLLNQPYIERIDVSINANYLNTGLIKLITGPRRAGKSVLSLQMLKEQNFAYLNFDDNLLLKNFDENAVIQSLNEVYSGFRYLLLDEIQNLPDWELWVNKLHRRGINMLITGSNAKLLSHEIATSLTGRYIQITVLPFSFAEVLRYNNITLREHKNLTPKKLGDILNQLNTYLINGGFPETVKNPLILKNYLSALFDSVILKDILNRFKIRKSQQLFDLSNYFLTNYTNLYSFNQIKKFLNLNSVATVQKFAGYLEEPYMFLHLPRYSTKIKKQQKAPGKMYIIDNGFIKARSFDMSPNIGRLLENLVFIELLRRDFKPGLELFYYRTKNDREIDFLCRKGTKVNQLIQVCYDISHPKTHKRETEALIEAGSELSCNDLMLISWDKEEIIEKKGYQVRFVPAWKWLLHLPVSFL